MIQGIDNILKHYLQAAIEQNRLLYVNYSVKYIENKSY